MYLILSFFYSIKWFFHEDLGFILFFVLSSSYYGVWFLIVLLQRLVYRQFVTTWCFSSKDALFVCGRFRQESGFDQSKISNYGCQYVE